ncbi:MAG: FAD-dependent oxidoreductase, partial [Pararhizobium sp.]
MLGIAGSIKRVCLVLGIFVLFASSQAVAAVCQRADVVVYSGTPGGIAAAIQAARLKKSVILLEPTAH